MTLTSKTGVVLAAFSAFALTGLHPAAAQTIYNFEISSSQGTAAGKPLYQGQGALGLGGTVFNNANSNATNFTFTNAKDSNGTASTVGLQVAANGGTYTQPPSSTSTYTASDPAALFAQYLYSRSDGTTNFTLTNLPASTSYTLYLYGANNYYNQTNFSVNSVVQKTTASTNNNIAFTLGSNYVIYTGTTSATGTITGLVQPPVAGTGFGVLNGLQVELTPTPAPEPSQQSAFGIGLLGLAALGLKARRRGAAAV